MTNNNKIIICVLVVVCALLTYRMSSGHPTIIENFWGTLPTFVASTDVVNSKGYSIPQNNQSQLHFNPNPFINTSILSETNKQLLSNSLAPVSSSQYKQYATAIQQPSSRRNPIDTTEYYDDTANDENANGPPVFTVPGTYQSQLSPRFSPQGYSSYVKYELPEEKYLANRPNDPLMMANMIENRPIKESYGSNNYFQGEEPTKQKTEYDALKKQGDEVAAKLPLTTMNMLNTNEKPDIYYNVDRFIFALQRNRLQGLGDPIRGDIPCVPCNPSSNPDSNVWFRPSVTPATSLRSGAINVIAGVGNVTSQQTAELQMRSLGGSKDTFGGVSLTIPQNTPISNLQALQNANINMNNNFQLRADQTNPISTVQTTSFP